MDTVFKRFEPAKELEKIIECYWIMEDDNSEPRGHKIIPDGFTEIIFHYGEPYRIKLDREWETQSKSLLAGQITKHFYLENTGRSAVLGIKMKPTALAHLYRLPMDEYTDCVVDLSRVRGTEFSAIEALLASRPTHEKIIADLDAHFSAVFASGVYHENFADRAIAHIFSNHGMVNISELCSELGISERQLEYLFKRYVGLSPKFFARIIRFNYIFELVQKKDESWSSLAYEAAYFDQSHFIRNFKAFTGENPSKYSFDENTMANFFLNKNK